MSVADKPATLRAQMKHHEPIVCYEPRSMKEENWAESNVKNALRAEASKSSHVICYAVKTKQIDMRTSESTAHPLDGNDDKEPQAVCYSPHPAAFMGGQGAKARSIAYCYDGTTPTLKGVLSGSNTVPDVVYSIEGHVTCCRKMTKAGRNKADVMYEMNDG